MKEMNEKPIIIPEQLILLAAQKAMREQEVKKTQEMIKDGAFELSSGSREGIECGDYFEIHRATMEKNSLIRAQELLSKYELVSDYCEDTIQIGTKFKALLTYSANDVEIGEFFLIHKRVANESIQKFISCDSPLGIALKGSKTGDEIPFKLANGNAALAKVLHIFSKSEKDLEMSETEKTR